MLAKQGLEPVSPLDGVDNGKSYLFYINRGLELLDSCEAIYLLPNWQKSFGARIEYNFAKKTRKIFMEIKQSR